MFFEVNGGQAVSETSVEKLLFSTPKLDYSPVLLSSDLEL